MDRPPYHVEQPDERRLKQLWYRWQEDPNADEWEPEDLLDLHLASVVRFHRLHRYKVLRESGARP